MECLSAALTGKSKPQSEAQPLKINSGIARGCTACSGQEITTQEGTKKVKMTPLYTTGTVTFNAENVAEALIWHPYRKRRGACIVCLPLATLL